MNQATASLPQNQTPTQDQPHKSGIRPATVQGRAITGREAAAADEWLDYDGLTFELWREIVSAGGAK